MASRVPRLGDHQKKNNSLFYLKKAKQACVKNDYAEAYENFVLYFESLNDPSESTAAVQTVFTKLVCKMGAVLEETSNIEELLKCYIQALNLFPDNYVILNNLGAYMFKISEIDIARRYLERAVKVNRNYLPAEINLMHVKWHQIPRWHFRMLNDKSRNMAFEAAIKSIIKEGYRNVIDIGAGCGLLSLIAAHMPGTSVVAIEENKQLYNMCLDILKKNEVTNVKVLHCYSTDIEEPPDKCNLLVTEVFDCALFGERALETIYHASTVLRTEEDYKIVPCGAKLYVTGISSQDLIKRHKWTLDKSLQLLNLQNVCLTEYDLEPYEAETLIERDVKYMTDIHQVFDIDFYNLEQISEILNDDSYEKLIQLRCIEEGELHAFAVWFDLNLTECISITNNPLDEDQVTCWEQAIIYLDHPVQVVKGTIITIKVAVRDCGLNVTLVETEAGNHTCFKVSKEVVTFLNDQKLVDCIAALAPKFWNTNLTVVDNNSCPLLGFLLAKNNCSTVYHPIKTEADRTFFEYVLSANHIPKERFVIVSELEVTPGQETCIFFFDTVNVDGSLENCCFKKNEIGSSINIPQSLSIMVQLISSPYIEFCNRVDDENVLEFKIADVINEYSGYEHPNLERLMYTEHSPPVKFQLDGDGEKSKDIIVTRKGVSNALLLWYDIQFYDDIVYSTLNSMHFKKTCFFFDEPKELELGDGVSIKMQTNGTYMKFYI
ncbi:unnamed protein product [Psylliodes chrysocephalus]|uniref:Protein arginine N-methyltransferase domain-containing protein n=1 Tax=Psylliodes chrysocephalus TaxID=3402493 RepID=A0A9P0CIA9_9CUCU|nr:unnamed protein product [Psylliodes chrysocephala]